MSDKPPDWSIKKELQKRKTQEIIRGVEQKRISQAMDPVPSPADKDSQSPKTTTGEVKRTTSSVPAAKTTTGTLPAAKTTTGEVKRASQSIPAVKPGTGELNRATQISQAARRTTAVPIPSVAEMSRLNRRQLLMPVLVGTLVFLIIAMGLAIAAGGLKVSRVTPTLVRLPILSAQDSLDYLKKVGVPISNLKSYPTPNETWHAKQEYQFDVQNVEGKGTFLILSYASLSGAASDSVRAARDAKYKAWARQLYGSVLVLTPPDSTSSINTMISSHLTQFILAPYLRFISTATPTAAPVTPTTPTS